MQPFQGLYVYEIAMLIGGCLLFMALLLGLVICIVKNRSMAGLYPFFLLTIVMIGFPAYSKIQISKDGVELDKQTHDLQANPTDQNLRAMVAGETARLADRPIQDPAILANVARAQIALGNNQAAQSTVEKIAQVSPQNSNLLELRERLNLDKSLAGLTATVEQHPDDAAAKTQLAQTVATASKQQIASPVTILNLAKGHALLGNVGEARINANKALQITPKSPQALELSKKLGPA